MIKIIDGKKYDSDNAELVCSFDNGLPKTDFKYYEAGLYVTKNGNYFWYGKGGPQSMFYHKSGNMTSGGTNIVPTSKETAFHWCQTSEIDVDIIEKYFSDMVKEA